MIDGVEPFATPGDVQRLRDRLEELESTLDAIRLGQVDALVTTGADGDCVFTLKSADQPYRVLVETMNEGAAMLAPDGAILYCNPRFATLVGAPDEQVTGGSLFDFMPSSEHALCTEMLQGALKHASHVDSVIKTAEGGLTPVRLSVSRAVVDDVVSVCLVATDLTEQKKNEQIVASEKLARSILDQAMEAIVVCDEAGRIIRTNPVARSVCDALRVGAILDEEVSFYLASGESFSVSSILKGERLSAVEATLQNTPEPVIVLISAGPLLGAHGETLGAVITLTDISERKRYENALREQSEQLARSNSDLERFAFAASHDLQEPLRMVKTYTQLLTRTYRSAVGQDAEMFARYVEIGAERMRQLISDLLSYSRVIHNPELNFIETSMNDVLAATLTDLHLILREAEAKIEADDLPPVCGDPLQLAQVFQNLITNAVKYCRSGPASVQIKATRGSDWHTFAVTDNGPGIPEAYQEQVFGLFKRLHGKDIPGSGMGLALCRRIVELHGGRIWVENNVGQGAAFKFTLPAPKPHTHPLDSGA